MLCVLLSLPKNFEYVSTALETIPIDRLTLEFAKGRLLDANIKINSENGNVKNPSSSAFAAIPRKDVICFTCGQKGHYKNECFKTSNSTMKVQM